MVDGASRVSLAAATDRLDTLAPTLDDAALGTLASDLAAVTRLLEDQYALRRTLADPGRSTEVRAGLLERVLRGKITDVALDLLAGVVRERWSNPADLVEATSRLAASATLALAQSHGDLDRVEDELFRFSRVIAGNAELALALSSPALPAERKSAIVHKLLDGKATAETVALVELVLADSRGKSLERRLEGVLKVAAERRMRLVAVVRAAAPPTGEQLDRLAAAVGRLYGHEVRLEVDLDPELIGGLVVTVGDEVIDGSVLHRLAEARRALQR